MNDAPTIPSCRLLAAVLAALAACVPAKLDLFDSDTAPGPGGTSTTTTTTTGATTSANLTTSAGTTDGTTSAGTTGDGPVNCDDPVADCSDDPERDGLVFVCDNAPDHFNPDQSDVDQDGVGDVADLCPTVANADSVKADTDKDGIGNACDLCERAVVWYNGDSPAIPAYMRVRNIPQVDDSDHDGVGDACDNCIKTPNCQGYGDGLDPYSLGDPIDHEAPDCQQDADDDLVGDACAGTMLPGAAGPVGFAPTDDFDQDGLANQQDICPRQPVPLQACDGPEDCADSGTCTAGVCNHRDTDQDGVGDLCDTCPFKANPTQIIEGGAEEDDPDGDFVGNACETAVECFDFVDPRRIGFYDGSVGGHCCVQLNHSGTTIDPDGQVVPLPAKVLATPGVGVLPPGCTQEAQPVDPALGLAALWSSFCLLPQSDQDLDGIADSCDLCPYDFDPTNQPYVDEDNQIWPHNGKYCNGDYSPENRDPAMMCLPGT